MFFEGIVDKVPASFKLSFFHIAIVYGVDFLVRPPSFKNHLKHIHHEYKS